MQDGQIAKNTQFEDQLNAAGFKLPNPPAVDIFANSDVQEKDPATLLYDFQNKINSIPNRSSPASKYPVNPAQIDVSGRYPLQRLGEDNEDLYGRGQSSFEQMWHGLVKGLTTTGTTFLEGTLGLAYGIADAIGTGKISHLYDNDVNNALQNWNQSLENKLPNYYTAKARSRDWWEPANLLSANFVWDKFVKNLGFSIGAIYSGAVVTKALRFVPELFNLSLTERAAQAAQTSEEALSLTPATERLNKFQSIVRANSEKVVLANKLLSPTERFVVSTLGATTEAGIEALQGVNDYRNKATQDYTEQFGYAPTGDALDKINDYATQLGNARFGLNIALLTATNYVQLPKILGSKYSTSKMLANGLEEEVSPIAKNAETQLFERTLPTSKMGKLLYKSKNIGELFFAPVEAFEEGAQNVIQLGVQDYYNKKYKGEGADFMNSLGQATYDTIHTNEGMEQIFIGGISGGMQQAGFIGGYTKENGKQGFGFFKGGHLGERGLTGYQGTRATRTQDFLDSINKSKLTFKSDKWLAETAAAVARGVNLQIEGENYINQGDVLESKDNEFDYQHNYLTPRIKYGRFDLVKDDISNYRQMASTKGGFEYLQNKGVANKNDTIQTFTQRLNNFERHVDNVNSLYQSLNVRYGGLINTKTKEKAYPEETIDKMVYAASKIADYDQRVPQLSQNLSSRGVAIQPALEEILENNIHAQTATKEALDEINNLNTTSEEKDNLKSDFRDVVELSLRRKHFIKEFDAIKANPQDYSEAPIEHTTNTTIPQITKTPSGRRKTIEKNVELNKPYSLNEPIIRQGNKLAVAPKITILSQILGGEYEAKLPTGETTFISRDEFKNYNLSDTTNDNTTLSIAVSNAVFKLVNNKKQFQKYKDGLNQLNLSGNAVQAIIDWVNSKDDPALVDAIQIEIKAVVKEQEQKRAKELVEQEKLAKDEQLRKELESYRQAASLKAGTLTLDANDTPTLSTLDKSNDYYKAPLKSFLSKEADFYDLNNPKPHQKRRLSFLTNIARIENSDKAKNIRVLAITKNNEGHFGLTGLIKYIEQDLNSTLTDPEQRKKYLNPDGTIKEIHTPIIKLYATKDKSGLYLTDVNGNKLSPLSGNIVEEAVNKGIFSVFHSTLSGTYEFGSHEGEPNYSKGTEQELKQAQKQFDEWRKRTLSLTDTSPEYPILSISRGIVLRDDVDKLVTSTNLVSTEELDNEGIITIPTIENQITIGDVSLNFPVGQSLLTNGSNVEFLNNRQFTEKEANDIFHFVKELVTLITGKKKQEAQRLQNFLSSILYLRSPKEGEQSTSNAQVYFANTDGIWNMHFGTTLQTAFTPQSIENNRDAIISYFHSYYIKANNSILKENANLGFEYAIVNPEGETEYKQSPSYSRYLLSTPDTTPILRTRAIKSTGPNDPTIISRYTTLQSSEFDFAQQPEPIKETKKQPIPQEGNNEENTVFEEEQSLSVFGPKNKEEAPKEQKATGLATGLFSGKKASQQEIDEIDRIQRAEIEKMKRDAKDKPFDSGEFKFALDHTINYIPLDVSKELSYIQEKTPFNVEILNDIIKTPEGIYAWGRYKSSVISLYNKAQEGVGYHEVFEGVFKEFLSQKEKNNILNEFKTRKGSFTYFDGNEYHSIPHSEATEPRMKETLADEFADYILTKEKPIKTGSSISRFFSNLWNFIKSIFTGDVQSIDQLFEKIDAGDYKSAPYNPNSISEDEEYSLADLNYTQQYETIRGVALQIVQELLNHNNIDSISLVEFDESEPDVKEFYKNAYQRLRDLYTIGIFKDEMGLNDKPNLQYSYIKVWNNISKDWNTIKSLTNEYLKTFGIIETLRGENSDEYISRIEKENYSNKEYVDDDKYFKNDVKMTSARSIKLLIATLPESDFNSITGKLESKRTASTLMQQQVQYAKTFNHLLAQLTVLNSYEDKMNRLKELGESNANFRRLYERLEAESNISNPNSVLNDWKLKMKFFQTMSKQSPTAYIQYNNQNGTSFTGTSDLQNSSKIISQAWIDGLKSLAISGDSKIAVTDNNGNLILQTNHLNINIATPEGKIEFLNRLNIPFTIQIYNSLSQQNKDKFNQSTIGLSHQIRRKSTYPLEDARSLESVKNLEQLAETFILSGNDFESTFPDINGERRTKFISTNKISRDVNDINQYQTKEQLLQQMPQLQQLTDSVYLNTIIFNEKGEKKPSFRFDVGYIQGTIDNNQKPIPGNKLTEYQRLNQEINQNLNSRYYILVPADSKTQWLLTMQNLVSYKNIAANSNDWLNRTLSQFAIYYTTEKQSYEQMKTQGIKDVEKRSGIFKELSNNYTLTEEQLKPVLQQFFEFQVNEQFKFLQKFHTIKANGRKDTYTWDNLDGDFLNKEGLKNNTLTVEDIKNILLFRTINYAFNNIEIQKLFFGDILNYKDVKRYKLFLSPRETSFTGSKDFNNYLNQNFNQAHGTKLKDPLLGKFTFSDVMRTVTMNDVMVQNDELAKIDKAYNDVNSTDAEAWSTLPAMRARRLKETTWTERDNKEYEYRMAVDRLLMHEDGILNDALYPKTMQNADTLIKSKGNPNSSYFYVEKPIYSGFTDVNGLFQPLVDKFSIVSKSYSAIRNTNFRDHYVKMLKQEIGYIIVKSGRKLGPQQADNFYNPDGSVNTSPYTATVNINLRDFGVQTDTSSKKESQARGTQITTLSTANLYSNGEAISPEAKSLVDNNKQLLNELTEIGYKGLLKIIGAIDVDGEYRIQDKTKILELVNSELLRREVADSIKQQLKLTSDKQLKTAFEALPNYQQIKNILYSYVDKYITSPKVGSGGQKIQVSGALMEKYGLKRTVINNKDVYTSSGLKFYTKDEPYMEVLLPSWLGRKLRKAGLEWKTEEELYSLFSQSPDVDKLLSGIGFRIPTQELNSLENFKIVGFLPEEMGDTVIVPEEITTKSGSDFDVDKLNTYLKNVYVDGKGQIRIIPYNGIGAEAKEKLSSIVSENNIKKLFKLTAKDRIQAYTGEQDELQYDEELDRMENEEFLDEIYKQSIENEYFANIQQILELPENFDRLVTPNTADDLKAIRDILVDIAPSEFDVVGNKSIISPLHMLRVRHEGQSVRSLVGIAAVSQTRTVKAQKSVITINPDNFRTLSRGDQNILGPSASFNIALPHNEINGKATLSTSKDVEGRYITDKNSQYLNGTVDVFNDAFLAQLNFNNRTAGVYMMLEDLGIPNSPKHPIVSFFMNQPIVRQFLNRLDVDNIKSPTTRLGTQTAEEIKRFFPTKSPRTTSLPQSLNELTATLSDSIKKYYNGVDLTSQQNSQQQFILDEYLKYAVLSNQLLAFQQGSNYDTATFNNSSSVYLKENQRRKSEYQNVWDSVQQFMDNTHVTNQRQAIIDATTALKDVFTIENSITKQHLLPIYDWIANKYISQDDKISLVRKLEDSLLNFLIQNTSKINNSIKHMLVDSETALVNELKKFKKTTTDRDNIWGNIILKQLIPYIKGRTKNSTKNISLAVKARDVFTKNLYNSAFEELLQHPKTEKLAKSLVKLSFIQSGISNSPISYKDAIPANVYSSVVKEAIDNLQNEDLLQSFIQTNSFFRNNWNDDDVVPVVDSEKYPVIKYDPLIDYVNILKNQQQLSQDVKPPLVIWTNLMDGNNPFLTHIQYSDDPTGVEPNLKRIFQRVEDSLGDPIIRKIEQIDFQGRRFTSRSILYIHSNAWGDSFRAQEYYPTNQQSVFNNGYLKVTPLNVNDIYTYIEEGIVNTPIIPEEQKQLPPIEDKSFEKLKNQLPKKDCS